MSAPSRVITSDEVLKQANTIICIKMNGGITPAIRSLMYIYILFPKMINHIPLQINEISPPGLNESAITVMFLSIFSHQSCCSSTLRRAAFYLLLLDGSCCLCLCSDPLFLLAHRSFDGGVSVMKDRYSYSYHRISCRVIRI